MTDNAELLESVAQRAQKIIEDGAEFTMLLGQDTTQLFRKLTYESNLREMMYPPQNDIGELLLELAAQAVALHELNGGTYD
jgi:hypothetical protein